MISTLNLNEKIFELPVFFSQVREDCSLDLQVITSIKRPCRVLMIASGGDTLCSLAANKEVIGIDAVDASRAQINLCKIKHSLLKFSPENRLKILGHLSMDNTIRVQILNEICQEQGFYLSAIGPEEVLSSEGPDFCGRYEQLFRGITSELLKYGITRENIQSKLKTLEEIFEEYFDLELLISLFGEAATRNPVQSFKAHFYRQTSKYLLNERGLCSPFLNQMLWGNFSKHHYEWHKLNSLTDQEICDVRFHNAMMLDFLKNSQSQSYDYIHLSNILDWLSPCEAEEVLRESFRCLRRGGRTIIRQLNSSLDIEKAGSLFNWDQQLGDQLLRCDKSFFYRKVLVGERSL